MLKLIAVTNRELCRQNYWDHMEQIAASDIDSIILREKGHKLRKKNAAPVQSAPETVCPQLFRPRRRQTPYPPFPMPTGLFAVPYGDYLLYDQSGSFRTQCR